MTFTCHSHLGNTHFDPHPQATKSTADEINGYFERKLENLKAFYLSEKAKDMVH